MKKAIQSLNRLIAGTGSLFLIPLMVITTCEVISRDFFGRPIAGVIELSEYMLAVFILLGLAHAQQVKAHVGVSLFTSRLSSRFQLILKMVTTLLSLILFSLLAWQGWAIGIEERTVSDMLRIPQYPFRLLVGLAAFLVCLELLIDLTETIRKLKGRSS
ncbi:MAG: TRAP transporter small permease [Syntrophaceae bacterium]|nr:TRAP transporter small permease [Syntrophaceae bacterium]